MAQRLIGSTLFLHHSAGGASSAFSSAKSNTQLKDFDAMAKSPIAWQRVAGLVMKEWNEGTGKDEISQDMRHLRNGHIYDEIVKAKDVKQAIAVFEQEKCVLGLVLIASLREGSDVEAAVRSLAKFATSDEMHQAGAAVNTELSGYSRNGGDRLGVRIEGGLTPWTPPYAQPELVGKIAMETSSIELMAYIFFSHSTTLGFEKTKPMMTRLIEANRWFEINNAANHLPPEAIAEVGRYVEIKNMTDAPFGHPALMIRIAALHPNELVRIDAIKRLKEGARKEKGGHGSGWLAESAAQTPSYLVATAKFALDASAEIQRSYKWDSIYSGSLDVALTAEVKQEIRAYALEKLFGLWDEFSGYSSIHNSGTPQDVIDAQCKYFEKNFEKLKANGEIDALVFLAYKSTEYRDRTVDWLAHNYPWQTKTNHPVWSVLAKYSPSKEIRKTAGQFSENGLPKRQA